MRNAPRCLSGEGLSEGDQSCCGEPFGKGASTKNAIFVGFRGS